MIKLSSKMVYEKVEGYSGKVTKPIYAYKMLTELYGTSPQEHFISMYLNANKDVTGYSVISIGKRNQSIVDVSAIFRNAILACADTIVVAHNHPSGNLQFSACDIAATKRLIKAGEIMDISVIDHIIFNQSEYIAYTDTVR